MCAGKLLSLIKKCLHQEKAGQKCDCGGQHATTTTTKSGHRSPRSSSSTMTTSNKKKSPPPPAQAQSCCGCPPHHHHHHHHQTQPGYQQVPVGLDRTGYTKMCSNSGSSPRAEHPHAHGHSGMHCGHTCMTSPVVYVPSTTPMDRGRVEREVALQREHQRRVQGMQTDMELNLPPAIRISEDGEEGYAHSQRILKMSCEQRCVESIRPPPNKTVYQGDSPPPYRSQSVGKMDGHYMKRGGVGGGAGPHQSYPPACLGHKQACGPAHGPHIVARCHSISSGDKRLPTYPSHQVRHSVAPPCGHGQVAPGCGSSHVSPVAGGPGGHASLTHSSHSPHSPFSSSSSGHSHRVDGPGGTATSGAANHQQIQSTTGSGPAAAAASARICSHSNGLSWNGAHSSTQNNNNHSNHTGSSCQDNGALTYYGSPPEYSEAVKEPATAAAAGPRTGVDSSCHVTRTVQSNSIV